MTNVILGGYCDHTQVIPDEELHQYTVDLMDQSDGLLVGRKIYQLMERLGQPLPATSTIGNPSTSSRRSWIMYRGRTLLVEGASLRCMKNKEDFHG